MKDLKEIFEKYSGYYADISILEDDYDDRDADFTVQAITFEDFKEAVCEYEQSKWVSVEERLPESGRPVLIWHKDRSDVDGAVAFCIDDRWFIFHSETPDGRITPPTHWQPLPTPPKP